MRFRVQCKDGNIGMAHCPLWYEPYDLACVEDNEAAERAMEFMFGWYGRVLILFLIIIIKVFNELRGLLILFLLLIV